MIIITEQDDVLDELLTRNLGSSASLEEVLSNNPVLGAYGAHLPAGLQIEVADSTEQTQTSDVVALWD